MPPTWPSLFSGWSAFRRHDLDRVIRIVGEVAASGDPGAYGHGVEVVVESPPLRWWQRGAVSSDGDRSARDQARIAVTGEHGRAGYPVHVRLRTGHGISAVRRVDRRDGWATSVTAGATLPGGSEAIIMLKQSQRTSFDSRELVEGTVAALDDLHPLSRNRGWRVRVDRNVRRS